MSETLKKTCQNRPEEIVSVIITLATSYQNAQADEVGLTGSQSIEGLPGIFVGELPGSEIMILAARPEIESIVENFEVNAQQ